MFGKKVENMKNDELLKKGKIALKKRDWRKAELYLAELVKRNPNDAGHLVQLSIILLQLQRNKDALQYLRRAMAIDRSNLRVATLYGSTLIEVGQVEDGIAELERVLKLDPMISIARVALAIHGGSGDLLRIDHLVGKYRQDTQGTPVLEIGDFLTEVAQISVVSGKSVSIRELCELGPIKIDGFMELLRDEVVVLGFSWKTEEIDDDTWITFHVNS